MKSASFSLVPPLCLVQDPDRRLFLTVARGCAALEKLSMAHNEVSDLGDSLAGLTQLQVGSQSGLKPETKHWHGPRLAFFLPLARLRWQIITSSAFVTP